MIAFAVTLAWIAWRLRISEVDEEGSATPPRTATKRARPPIGWLLTLALVAALIACVVSCDSEISMNIRMALIVNLSWIVLRTLGIYFFLLLGACG